MFDDRSADRKAYDTYTAYCALVGVFPMDFYDWAVCSNKLSSRDVVEYLGFKSE